MIKITLPLLAVSSLLFVSCGGGKSGTKGAWESSFRKEIHADCMGVAKKIFEKDGEVFNAKMKKRASGLCDCTVDKLESNYDPSDEMPESYFESYFLDCELVLLQDELKEMDSLGIQTESEYEDYKDEQ